MAVISGARKGKPNRLRRLLARAMARELAAFVVPSLQVALSRGLDLEAAGLRLAVTPRHATVLLLIGELSEEVRRAAAVAYAQVPRPRAVLAVGAADVRPLPPPDVSVPLDQASLVSGVRELRQRIAEGAFAAEVADFDPDVLRTETEYVCPMHPEVVRNEPGECPICGMDLVPRETAGGTPNGGGRPAHHTPAAMEPLAVSQQTDIEKYTCPMHPEVVQAVPGKCPICKMKLVPMDPGAARPQQAAASDTTAEYTCPMHPQVVQGEPGACPICGMDLVAREAAGGDVDHGAMSHEGADHGMHMERGAWVTGREAMALEHEERDSREYTCSMHPEVVRKEPGSCPICGMDLVPRATEDGVTNHADRHRAGPDLGAEKDPSPAPGEHEEPGGTQYACPMHPEIVRGEPGSCPVCGMRLVPRRPTTGMVGHGDTPAAHADSHCEEGRATTVYTCPMHPEVVRPEPGRCPICGMGLVAGEAGVHEMYRVATAAGRDAGEERDGHAGEADHDPRASTADGEAGASADAEHSRATAAGDQKEMEHGLSEASEHQQSGHAAERHGGGDHGELAHGAHERTGHDPHGGTPMDHSSHGGMSNGAMDHGDMEFMSMVEMTKDLPRSADGLPMERVEAPFGPLFPGLPGGLNLKLTLDGDTVAEAEVRPGTVSLGLEATWPGDAATFAERLARLDPLAPVAYRLLAQRAVEDAADVAPDERTLRARIGALERERAASHLGWLVGFAGLLGDAWLARQASRLQLALLHTANAEEVTLLEPAIRRLVGRARRTPGLSHRLRGTGCVDSPLEIRGPVARASGLEIDARTSDPAYGALAFAPVIWQGGDALARLHVRLSEIVRSVEMIRDAGDLSLSGAAVGSPASGTGVATVETSRGAATLEVRLEDGQVTQVRLDTPSTAHLGLVSRVAEGQELADALVGIASLDLSPWEVGR